MVRTDWLLYFEARDTKVVAALGRMPDRNEEPVLWRLAEVTRGVLTRCKEGVKKAPNIVRRWLNSPKPAECNPQPFNTLQEEASRERYFNYWVRFLCFLLRVVRANSEEEHKVQLSPNERNMANALFRSLQAVESGSGGSGEATSSGNGNGNGNGNENEWWHDETMGSVLRFSVAFVQKSLSSK